MTCGGAGKRKTNDGDGASDAKVDMSDPKYVVVPKKDGSNQRF